MISHIMGEYTKHKIFRDNPGTLIREHNIILVFCPYKGHYGGKQGKHQDNTVYPGMPLENQFDLLMCKYNI